MEIDESIQAEAEDDDLSALIEAFARFLFGEWVVLSDEGLAEAADVLERGIKVGAVLSIFDALLGAVYARRIRQRVTDVQQLAYEIGLEGVRLPRSLRGILPSTGSIIDERVLAWQEQYDMYWLRSHYERDVRDQIRKAAAEVQTQRLLGKDAGSLFQKDLSGILKGDGARNYFELVSEAVSVRSRSLADLEAFARLGVEEYDWVAVLDRKTSQICQHLDGMRFKVSDALAWRDRLLNVDQSDPMWPERIKEISPWLKEEQVVGKSAAEIARLGVLLPPAHGHCRSTIRPVLGD